jgi:hypothetical protein
MLESTTSARTQRSLNILYAKRRESDEKKIENNEEVVVASLFHRETLFRLVYFYLLI